MTKKQAPLTQDQIAAINRLAQRGYGIERIDEIFTDAVVVSKCLDRTAKCELGSFKKTCAQYEPIHVGDKVVCARVKLYDRPAMRWLCFKSDRAWVLDELTRLGQEMGDYD